jgi:oxaloacetate decarboxylase alpha subunit/pyruvate carboxylase subunit B
MAAPMPGLIVRIDKNVGDAVNEGDTVLVLEAMKMENALPAPCSGTVKAVNVASGDNVGKGDALVVIG